MDDSWFNIISKKQFFLKPRVSQLSSYLKNSVAAIARVTNVSEPWLQDDVNAQYAETVQQAFVSSKTKEK